MPRRSSSRRGPIAGTRPRFAGDDDAARIRELVGHPKERAEHVMLIDLERNDLGRVCTPGSVEVDELMTVESYAHVHHIVSNVRGRLRADATPGEVIRAVFPGGTITGCPKVRCMQIIAELEGAGRGAYTGAIGWLNRDGDLDLNILIRSAEVEGHADGSAALPHRRRHRGRLRSRSANSTKRAPRRAACCARWERRDERRASFVGDDAHRGDRRPTIAAWPTATACSRRCACIAAACRWWDAHWARLRARRATRLRLPLAGRGASVDAEMRRAGRRQRRRRAEAGRHARQRAGAAMRRLRMPTPTVDAVARMPCRRRRAPGGLVAALVRHCAWRSSRRWPASSTATGSSRCWRAPNGDDAGIDEGLMRDTEGDVVCATAANLFVLRDGRWIDAAGRSLRRGRHLPGVVLIDALDAPAKPPGVADVEAADAVFLCNAVRGILPVARLGVRALAAASEAVALRSAAWPTRIRPSHDLEIA